VPRRYVPAICLCIHTCTHVYVCVCMLSFFGLLCVCIGTYIDICHARHVRVCVRVCAHVCLAYQYYIFLNRCKRTRLQKNAHLLKIR